MDKRLIKKTAIALALVLIFGWQASALAEKAAVEQTTAAESNAPTSTPAAASASTPALSAPTSSPVTNKTAEPVTTTAKTSPVVESAPLTYSQSQDIMLKSAPADATPPSEEAVAAFNTMMQQHMPLSPQQVVKLRQIIDESQRAAIIPAVVPPRPVSTTMVVNLAPGSTPPAIRLAQGYVTSLLFVDTTGAPWPIASFDIGDPKTTSIQWDGKSNVILLQATAPYGNSDLVVRLVGMMTPVTLELVLGQRVVDYRTDIHVPGVGPEAKSLPAGTGLPNNPNQVLLDVLDGIAPATSKALTVTGGDCQAWLLGEKMFLRTRLTILSPGWNGKMVSPDGMYAYEMQKTSSVLVSHYGEPLELKIGGL